jgi:hypothetical protein
MNYVLLGTYENYIDAHIVQGRLEEEGISCWLKDEHTLTINPLWNNALGYIKLMVPDTQYERALEILNGPSRGPEGPDAPQWD